MKRVLILLFFMLSLSAFSQDSMKVIGIHPSIGKTISKGDKVGYQLFPEYKDSVFASAYVIMNTDSSYTLSVITPANKVIKRPISTQELDEIHFKIGSKGKAETVDYVQSEPEKKAIRKERANRTFMNVIAQIALVSFQVLLTAAFIQ